MKETSRHVVDPRDHRRHLRRFMGGVQGPQTDAAPAAVAARGPEEARVLAATELRAGARGFPAPAVQHDHAVLFRTRAGRVLRRLPRAARLALVLSRRAAGFDPA